MHGIASNKQLRRTIGEVNALSTLKATSKMKSIQPHAPRLKSPSHEAARATIHPKRLPVTSRFEFTGSPNPQLSGVLVHGSQDPVVAA